jgi:hypothetical protein
LICFIGLILLRQGQKSPGMALCLIGVFMAIAAAVQGSASGTELAPNPGQFSMTPATGSGPMTKMAVILVLSGVGMMFLSRPDSLSAKSNQTEASHVA